MYKTTSIISGKRQFSKEKLESVMQEYTKKYCIALHELCSLGYSASPYSYNDIDFRTAIVEEFPNELRLLKKSLSSGISFNKTAISYAIKATKDEEFKHVMSTFLDIITAKEMLYDLDTLISSMKFNKRGIASSSVKVVVSEGVQVRSKVPLHAEMLLNEGYNKIKKINICECVIHELCKDIGLSEEEYQRHKSSGMPFFIEGVTQEEEELCSEGIVYGVIPLNGKYGDVLRNRMIDYYREYNEKYSELSTVQTDYERVIYARCTSERTHLLESLRAGLYAEGYKELYLDNTYAYYQKQEEIAPVVHQTIYVGNYCNIPDLVETFEGVQGVFSAIPEGVPANIKGYGTVYFCDNEDYTEFTEDDVFEEFEVSSIPELKVVLHKFTKSDVTAELLLALLKARCGIMQYTFEKDMSSVNEADYINCCKEALYILRYTFNLL